MENNFEKVYAEVHRLKEKEENNIKLEKQYDVIREEQAEAMAKGIMKLDKIFADFEKKAEASQDECEAQIKIIKKELTRSNTEHEREISNLHNTTKRQGDSIMSLQRQVEDIMLEKVQSMMKQEVIESIKKDITYKYDTLCTMLEKHKKKYKEIETNVESIKGNINTSLSEVKNMYKVNDEINSLRKGYEGINEKLNIVSKSHKLLTKQHKGTLLSKCDIDVIKELQEQKCKLGVIQRKVEELDLTVLEANKINKLNVDNLLLQVKNLQLSTKVEFSARQDTSCRMISMEGRTDKENKSFVYLNDEDQGKRFVVKLLKTGRPKTPARVGKIFVEKDLTSLETSKEPSLS